ncbi:hypothetical protein F25303_11722, partial [Fusarium sp. NRRL 25303]
MLSSLLRNSSESRLLWSRALPGRAVRMNQWTFFNKKIEAFKAQSNDGSTPSTPVKKATP